MAKTKNDILIINQIKKTRGYSPPELLHYFFLLYEPYSIPAKVWAFIVKYLNRFNIVDKVFKKEDPQRINFLGVSYRELENYLKEITKDENIRLVILMPYNPERKRLSGLIISEKNYFFKFGTSSKDKQSLLNEKNALLYVEKVKRSFNIPQLLNSTRFKNGVINVYESLPLNTRAIQPIWSNFIKGIWRNIYYDNLHAVEYKDLPLPLKSLIDVEEFNNEKFLFSIVHGDFAPWNIKLDGNSNIWLYDWEDFQTNAPYLVDPITFIVTSEYLLKKKNIFDICQKIEIELYRNLQAEKHDILMALLYMYQIRKEPIYKLVYNEMIKLGWRKSNYIY